jgi:hypothetical protein
MIGNETAKVAVCFISRIGFPPSNYKTAVRGHNVACIKPAAAPSPDVLPSLEA